MTASPNLGSISDSNPQPNATLLSHLRANPGLFASLIFLSLLGLLLLPFHLNLGLGFVLLATTTGLFRLPFRWDPLTRRKFRRFRQIKRGYFSFLLLSSICILSLFAEAFINNRALIVRHEGRFYFPFLSEVYLGNTFGLIGSEAFTPTNYRNLKGHWKESQAESWILMPWIPYSPNENNPFEGVLKPRPPSPQAQHYLGTDSTGRDILARLVYGFRTAIFFAFAFTILTYAIGIFVGCLIGYFGGWLDLLGQRLIEIWSNVPFLYTVIIAFSVIPSSYSVTIRITLLLTIMVLFSWTSMTYYMRTATLRERERDYAAAARVIGASPARIIFRHILPNTIATIITFVPFTVIGAITAITALDFLGFGLPPPTPSLGELLRQGTSRLDAWWIVSSAFFALVVLLTIITFVGEAIREAFDPKQHSTYE
ncbi:MAG: ABC transporter permease [Puniceicoccaceae bacterium]